MTDQQNRQNQGKIIVDFGLKFDKFLHHERSKNYFKIQVGIDVIPMP